MVQVLDVERVIVAFSNDSHEEMLDLIRSLKDLDIQIDLVPRFFEVIGTNVGIHTAEGLPLIGLPALRLSRSSRFMKRTMDLVALDHRPGPPRAALPRRRGLDQARLARARLLPPAADGRPATRPSRSSSSGRWPRTPTSGSRTTPPSTSTPDGDPRMFKIPNDPRVTRVRAGSCAASRSTSCRSSSTSSRAR